MNTACAASCSPDVGQTSIAMIDALSYDSVWGGGPARTYMSPAVWPLCNNDFSAAVCVYSHPSNDHSAVYFRNGGRASVIGTEVIVPIALSRFFE